MDRVRINPAMQPDVPRDQRAWQRLDGGEYAYGECPCCGASGRCVEEGASLIDESETETWHCRECGCEWEIDRDIIFRFGRILPED